MYICLCTWCLLSSEEGVTFPRTVIMNDCMCSTYKKIPRASLMSHVPHHSISNVLLPSVALLSNHCKTHSINIHSTQYPINPECHLNFSTCSDPEPGEMIQWLGERAALSEDPGSVPSAHTAAYGTCNSSFWDPTHFSSFPDIRAHKWYTGTQAKHL